MSARYPFTGDKSLLTHDGSVIWSDQIAVQPNLDFSNVADTTLTDSMNETYVTAVDDNETQYLSVLETTDDLTMEDLHNLTLGNSKVQFENENVLENLNQHVVDVGDQQVVVFSLDGSDDLFGIQITQDDDGNMQKYQFKFRATDDGQLEAIPESIELLPNDDESQTENVGGVGEVLVQEIETNNAEVQESPVFFFEDAQDGEVQETQVFIQQEEEATEEYVELQQENENVKVYIKGEANSPDFEDAHDESDQEYAEIHMHQKHEEIHYEEAETVPQEEHYEEIEDVKAGILEQSLALPVTGINIKQELLQEDSQGPVTYSEDSQEYNQYQSQNELDHHTDAKHQREQHQMQDDNYGDAEIEGDHETVLQYQRYVSCDGEHVYEESDTADSQNLQQPIHYEQLFIQENQVTVEKSVEIEAREDEESEEQFVTETGTENDSDNDDYQIVEGLHITAEGDMGDDPPSPVQEPETILQEVVEKPPASERANILKQPSLLKPMKEIKPKTNKTVVYYVVPHLEKENVNSLPINNNTTSYRPVIRSNPRTILKSSFPELRDDASVKSLADERLNKRFARSKEAVQARLFNNFISKTTIPHAPIRQTRLPRKQQIKPVDTRRNEEIIVQEVMVSSKGFIENVEEKLKNKDKLEVTSYVVLTDSDDDYDPKQGNKRKKKHKKHRKPDFVLDTDSDVSVIEIRSDEELPEEETRQDADKMESPKRGRGRPKKSPETKEGTEGMKRRRGRPPKAEADPEESPTKKSRTESDEDSGKKEIKCPHCTKTFPSQNSLSTHIQHHNLENSLRSKAAVPRAVEYRHKCDDCQSTFKNSILLKRHACQKPPAKTRTRLECALCKKTFPTAQSLDVHKRSHVKEMLVNATTAAKVSPKKCVTRASTSRFKSPKRVVDSVKTFKCKECSRVCYSQDGLALHEKTHRKYKCASCNAVFPSKLLLDTHVRVNCVKTATPTNKRLSFKIRKSFVQSPRRKSLRFARNSEQASKLTATSAGLNSTLDMKLECSTCGEKFQMFQDKFKHQVKVHGLETPDKSITVEQKKRLHKPKNLHGGIPARDSMKKAFADIRSKIALVTPIKDAN